MTVTHVAKTIIRCDAPHCQAERDTYVEGWTTSGRDDYCPDHSTEVVRTRPAPHVTPPDGGYIQRDHHS